MRFGWTNCDEATTYDNVCCCCMHAVGPCQNNDAFSIPPLKYDRDAHCENHSEKTIQVVLAREYHFSLKSTTKNAQ